MTDQHHNVVQPVITMFAVIVAWFGTIALGDVQTLVAILTGLAVLVYTVTNTFILWRDKIYRDRWIKAQIEARESGKMPLP